MSHTFPQKPCTNCGGETSLKIEYISGYSLFLLYVQVKDYQNKSKVGC